MPNRNPTLLICDLDNTLYDWVSYFVPSFYAMVDQIVEVTSCDREALLDDFRAVHQKHHDSEFPFAALETKTIKSFFSSYTVSEILEALDPAFYAFNSQRKKSLKLFDGVMETLKTLVSQEVVLVAHTESNLYAAVDRLNRTKITDFFAKIYCKERLPSVHPDEERALEWQKQVPTEKIVELTKHQRKPNVEVLLEICRREGFETANVFYIGDSIARDIMMAKDAGVGAIWAKYGVHEHDESYKKLVRVTHWTPEDVEREMFLKDKAQHVKPDYIANQSFSEVLDIIQSSKKLKLVNT